MGRRGLEPELWLPRVRSTEMVRGQNRGADGVGVVWGKGTADGSINWYWGGEGATVDSRGWRF